MITYIMSGDTITLFKNGIPKVINSEHINFEKIVETLRSGTGDPWPLVDQVGELKKTIPNLCDDLDVSIEGVTWKGEPLHGHLIERIITMQRGGHDTTPYKKFLTKVMAVEGMSLRKHLPDFIAKCNLPIFPDGDVMAWKVIKDDYRDWYSGKFDNSVGSTVQVERSSVNDDRQQTCSEGLHVAAFDYLPHYHWGPNSRVVVCKIDPRDFVSIPYDYENAKARVCKYVVVDEVPQDEVATRFHNQAVTYDYGGYLAHDDEIQYEENSGLEYDDEDDNYFPEDYDDDEPEVTTVYVPNVGTVTISVQKD